MARSQSWYPRLAEIHRQVTDSPRTPYTREEIGKLFRLKKAAAKELVQLMPRFEQQNSAVVERMDLLDFVNGCIDTDDLGAHLDAIRQSPPLPRRRKLRVFVPREFHAGNPETLSTDIRFSRNEFNVLFSDAEDAYSKIYQIITVLEDQEFQRRYCDPPVQTPQQRSMSAEKQTITLEMRYCAKLIAARKAAAEGDEQTFAERLHEASKISAKIRYDRVREGLPPPDKDNYLFTADEVLAVLSPAPPALPAVQTEPLASRPLPAAVPIPPQELEDRSAS